MDNRIRWWWRLCEWLGHQPEGVCAPDEDWCWRRCHRCRRVVLWTRKEPWWSVESNDERSL